MRLAAIYIKEHFLFEEGKPQTINFGGKNIYSFNPAASKDDEIIITKTENPDFIDDFWGENISLVSAIVGANGAGKTSVLEIINQSFRKRNKSLFIYEDLETNSFFYENRIADFDENEAVIPDSKIKIQATNLEISEVTNRIQKLYYSSIFDEKVSDFHSLLNLNSKYTNIPLSTIFSNNLRKEFTFLNSETSDYVKLIYNDFPKYDFISISANKLYKRDLENLYLGSNLGYTNIIEKFRTDIKWEIDRTKERLQDKNDKFQIEEQNKLLKFQNFLIYITEKDRLFDLFKIILDNVIDNKPIEDSFLQIFTNNDFNITEFDKKQKEQILNLINYLKGFSVTEVLRELWGKYPNVTNPSTSHLIHNGENLMKNLEINILSLITVNDVFQINGLQGSFNIDKILKETDFVKMMNKYLEKYLIQKHKTLYEIIIKQIDGDLDVLVHNKKIIEIIKSDKFLKEGGADTTEPKRKMIDDIEGFLSIIEFYNYIKEITDVGSSKVDLYAKESISLTILNTIFNKYEKVKLFFSRIALIDTDIIQFKADKNLSFGEKSLLNLYSTFYDFTLSEGYERNFENYLVLLDEGDLGYHPMWKKKYIDAITKTLPIVFNRLTPKFLNGNKYQNHKKENPTIQIIFATHDPLTLSDIPNSNIVYLKKNGDYRVITDNLKENKKSFGANITDLLVDSFFIEDGLVGDFAKVKIQEVIDFFKNKKSNLTKENCKKIIEMIDEPMMKNKLLEMYYRKFPKEFSKELEIKQLKELAKKHKFEIKEI